MFRPSFSRLLSTASQKVKILLQDGFPQLLFNINGQRRLFMVSDKMNINNLQEMILFDFPEMEIHIDISKAKGVANLNHSLYQFLLSQEDNGEIIITINDQELVLPNAMSSSTAKAFHKHMSEIQARDADSKIPSSSYSWMKQALDSGASMPSAGTLAHYCKAFQLQLSKKGNHSLDDLERYSRESLLMFTSPVRNEMFKTYHLLNDAKSELKHYQEVKEAIEELATGRIKKYIYAIFIASVLHFSAFYYMIFHVEWLGWDIVEPITYSLTQLTVLLGIRFHRKYGKARSWESLVEIFQQGVIKANPKIRVKYDFACRSIEERERTIKSLKQKTRILAIKQGHMDYESSIF